MSRVGQLQQGLPRADAQGALQPVPRRPGADAGERDPRSRAADRRGGRRQRRARRERVTVRGTLFNNRVNNPIANVTVATNNVPVTPGCAGVPTCRQLQNLGSTNIAGFQTDVSYRVNGHWGVSARLRVRHRQGARVEGRCGGQRSDGQVSRRGPEESRVVPGELHQPALPELLRSRISSSAISSTTT